MSPRRPVLLFAILSLALWGRCVARGAEVTRFPADGAAGVNPDTHLVLTFPRPPVLGGAGQIRIYDAADDRLVDVLDLGIPPGPTTSNRTPAPYTSTPYVYRPGRFTNANTKPGTPSGVAGPAPDNYQLTIIGGFTDGFHFYPVIVRDNTATIYPHHNLLEYGRTYYVQIDPGALTVGEAGFSGIAGKEGWTFTTKAAPPAPGATRLVVNGDGTGDFNTVQGAVDSIPDGEHGRVTIFIRNGRYEEIVYFRNKTDITFLGEDREKVVVCYANNEVFNPHPIDVATNEWPGTFPSRRAAFMADNSRGIHIVNFTIKSLNERPAQAEGLLLMGGRNIVSHVTIEGSGDALQINDSVYLTESRVLGIGDNVLGRGPAFFERCELVTTGGPHLWVRNTAANHGNVFLRCTFRTVGDAEAVFARAPVNKGRSYPHCEAVLLECALAGIRPEGWGPVGGATANVHYWELNSTNLDDGRPADVSRRAPHSRQLMRDNDAGLIASYRDPAFVLGGWAPAMAPHILTQPEAIEVAHGGTAVLHVVATAIPTANYQWSRNGEAIPGATSAEFRIAAAGAADAGRYVVTVANELGAVASRMAMLTVRPP